MTMPLNNPMPMPMPALGTIIELSESAVYQGIDPLRLRLSEVGQGGLAGGWESVVCLSDGRRVRKKGRRLARIRSHWS